MVATLASLQLTLLWRSLSRSAWRAVGFVVLGLYVLGMVLVLVAGLWLLGTQPATLVGGVTIAGFSIVTLAWVVVPLVVSGIDQTLAPASFALLPLPARRLMPGLLVAGLLGVAGVGTVLLCAGLVLAWRARLAAAVTAAVVAAPLGVAACLLVARTLTSAFASWLSSRRFRDLAAVVLALVAMSVGLAMQAVLQVFTGTSIAVLSQRFAAAAQLLAWTPVGWAWAVPADVAGGHLGAAVVHAVLAAALVLALWKAWEHFLDRALTSPLNGGATGGTVHSSAFVDRLFGEGPAAAIATRSLRYWRRDPRHLVALASILIVPVITLATAWLGSRQTGEPLGATMFMSAPLLGVMSGLGLVSELSYDGSALWTHISAGVSGRADRWGRVLAFGVIISPLLVIGVAAAVIVTGDAGLAAPSLAAGLVLALAGGGCASLFGALWQSPTPPAGDNPFSKGSGGGGASFLSSLLTLTGTGVVAAPVLVLCVLGLSNLGWGVAALGAALGWGGFVLWLGVRLGGRVLDARWPEVLHNVTFERG